MCNLANLSKNKIEAEWLYYIKAMQNNEEFVLNKKFKARTTPLQNCYTFCGRSRKYIKHPMIIHIVARKPWLMSAFRKYGISIKILWNKSAIPFIKPSSKLSFYLINFYGTFIVMFLYAFTKKTPIGKYIYNSAYTLLKKVII